MSILKKKAWELATEGVKNNFNKEWCRKFINSYDGLTEKEAVLLDNLLDLFVAYLKKWHTKEETQVLVNSYISSFKGDLK